MAKVTREFGVIARLYGVSIHAAEAYVNRVQRLCIIPPKVPHIAKACAELELSASEIEVAIRASELSGMTQANLKQLKEQTTRQRDGKGPSRDDNETETIKAIAQRSNMSILAVRKLIIKIQRLCLVKPSYAAVAAACYQLSHLLHREVDIAMRASEIEGLSGQNLKVRDKPQRANAPCSPASLDTSGSSVLGRKEIDRLYGEDQTQGISDIGDWESD